MRNSLRLFHDLKQYITIFASLKQMYMTRKQVKDYFINKKDIPCPLTDKLVKAGYQQIVSNGTRCNSYQSLT